jgi:pimeloyl-ACP methyl ester carboxylesterase
MAAVITGSAPPSLLEQAVATTTATGDYLLRTGLASVISASAVPSVLSKRSAAFEIEQLDFYAGLARAGDPLQVFRAPPRGVEVRAREVRPPHAMRGVGAMELLSFRSPFEALNPALRTEFASHRRNTIARAQHWRHLDGPRPTIIVLHGFMGSPYLFNSAFFSLPWFFGHGYDVLLATMPFHGRRASRTSPYSGHGYFAHGIAHLNESVLQAVSDVRVLVDHVLDSGAGAVGVTGLSLGGYTSAALAVAEPRLHFAIPNAALAEMSSLMRSWFPAGQLLDLALRRQGLGLDDLKAGLAVHSPLTYAPALAKDRLLIIGGLGDRLAPPEQSRMLWEQWGRPHLHWYPGNHVMHVQRGDYLREMGRFLQRTGFADHLPSGDG